jgi:serine/threonine protein kinase
VLREAIQNFAVPDGNAFGGTDSSELIRDFIQQCLCTDPAQRPSANVLLHHPYIVRAVQRGQVTADGSRPPRLRESLVHKAPTTNAEVDDIVDHIVQW